MQHFLFVICALAFINMSKADPTGQLPSKINLTYPEDRVNLNQHFEMSWSVGNMDLDPTATGISDVGVILPNGTIYTNPYFPMTCGTRNSAAFLTMPGFALAGRYVVDPPKHILSKTWPQILGFLEYHLLPSIHA
jgi:hypothetical protein